MKKQLLILLLSLFQITKTYIPGVTEQLGLLDPFIDFRNRYHNFQFDDIKKIALFSKEIDERTNKTVEGFLFKSFISNFLFHLLTELRHEVGRREHEAFDYLCNLEEQLLKRQLKDLIIEFIQIKNQGNTKKLLDFCEKLKELVNYYSSISERSNIKSSRIYQDGFYIPLQHLQAQVEFEVFKSRYINLESINSEEKFDECKQKMFLIKKFYDKKYLSKDKKICFYNIINQLVLETYKSPKPFHRPFFLKPNLYLNFGAPDAI